MVPWSDYGLVETPIATVSDWVLMKIEEVSVTLGLSSEGLEHLAWELFAKLEKRVVVRPTKECTRGSKNSERIPRELKNLS